MAQLAVIVMCRSERPPPDATCSLAYSATKSSATQKAAYVPRHIISQFFQCVLLKALPWVSWRFAQFLKGKVAVLGSYCGCCHVHSFVLNLFLRPKGAAECTCLPGRRALSRAPAKAFIGAKRRPFTA